MKVLFISKIDNNIGSSRIFVSNFAIWLKQLGHEVDINEANNNKEYQLVIIGKNTSLKKVREIRRKHSKSNLGIINPSDKNKEGLDTILLSDFLVVGSTTEKAYYEEYSKPALVVPLVERIFGKQKTHSDKDQITLGYHGNLSHLEEFNYGLKHALDKLSEQINIKLLVIYDKKNLGEWNRGRPEKIQIDERQWNIDNIENDLLECDIGLVPNLYPINSMFRKVAIKTTNLFSGIGSGPQNDILLRMKNNTNAGRAFVFFQLGIPVIADLNPEVFPVMSSPGNGYIVHGEEGWTRSIMELYNSSELRAKMSENAKAKFEKLYNPLYWIEHGLRQINT